MGGNLENRFTESGRRLSEIFQEALLLIKPGVNILEIDSFVEQKCKQLDCVPLFLGHHGFPAHTCISINEEIVHSIPKDRVIGSSDLVTLDLAIRYNGYCADMARTVSMDSSKDHQILTDSTKEAFFNALDIISAGVDIYEVGKVIRNTARKYGVKAIPDLTGHGIGKNMWESPFIFNIPFEHYRLNANRAVAIEPIFTAGNTTTKTLHDNWTIITADRSLSAHYEDTIFIGENGAKVVTYT